MTWGAALAAVALGCGADRSAGGESTDETGPPASDGAATTAADPTTDPSASEVGDGGANEGGVDEAGDGEDPPACDDSTGEFELDEGGGSSGGAEDESAGMGTDIPIGASVFTIRSGGIDAGTLVELEPVVVTAPPVPLPVTGWLVYVQMPESGPNTAIPVRVELAQSAVEELVPGDLVTFVGRPALRDGFASLLAENDVEVLGVAVVPEPVVLQVEDVVGGAIAEDYESVLVRVEQVEVELPEVCHGEVALVGGLRIGDLFLGADAPTPIEGATYSAIVGPLVYEQDGYEVAPRSLADLVP